MVPTAIKREICCKITIMTVKSDFTLGQKASFLHFFQKNPFPRKTAEIHYRSKNYLCVMKIQLLVIGKTDDAYLSEGIAKYAERLKHYAQFEMKFLPDLKNRKALSEEQQKKAEGELLLMQFQQSDTIILLDENGKQHDSVGFANALEKQMLSGSKRLVFTIGGPYGFSEAVYARAQAKISLSPMTFSHQMVRLIFVEQLYRAFTIIKGEPYHHV